MGPRLVAEGVALISATLAAQNRLGPYQLQAAIAAVHDEAARSDDTDWPQIAALYGLLERLPPTPWSRSTGRWPRRWSTAARPGSTWWPHSTTTTAWPVTTGSAVRAHLLEMAGEHDEPGTGRRR